MQRTAIAKEWLPASMARVWSVLVAGMLLAIERMHPIEWLVWNDWQS
jgi:hypothetical protein